MDYKFLDLNKKIYIRTLVKEKILKNLIKEEFDVLMTYLFFIIEYITIRFSIIESTFISFWYQLTQNNNRDIIALFNLLLPYIDDKEGTFILHHQIIELKDISCKLNNNLYNNNNKSINKYLISNVQYNLYNNK